MTGGVSINRAVLWNGSIAVVGTFSVIGSTSTTGAAIWDFPTRSWSALGSGLSGGSPGTAGFTLVEMANGDLLVGGRFASAGATSANNIASWNGTTWSALGTGVDGSVHALVVLPNGDVVAGGEFNNAGGSAASKIARWDGSSWSAFGAGVGPSSGAVFSLAVLPNGDLVAAGNFSSVGGVSANNVAIWNGSTWSALGSGTNGSAITTTVDQLGTLWVGGAFTTAGGGTALGLAAWNGSWTFGLSGAGLGTVTALTTMASGVVLATGTFGIFPAADRIWMYDGVSASTFGDLGSGGGIGAGITDIGNDEFVVVGTFSDLTFRGIRPFSKCLPTAIGLGAACASSVGTHVRIGTLPPQIGSTFASATNSMPASSFAMQALGVGTASVGMDVLFPGIGSPTCILTNTADVINGPFLPFAGVVTCSFAVPFSMALIGSVLFEQDLMFETDSDSNVIAVTVNQGLTLTIGYW